MGIFSLSSGYTTTSGKLFGFCFEHEARSIDELHLAFVQDGVVAADRLFTHDDGKGGRQIHRRERILIGKSQFSTIGLPIHEHYELSAEEGGGDDRHTDDA